MRHEPVCLVSSAANGPIAVNYSQLPAARLADLATITGPVSVRPSSAVEVLAVGAHYLRLLQTAEVEEVRRPMQLVVELLRVRQRDLVLHVRVVVHACSNQRKHRSPQSSWLELNTANTVVGTELHTTMAAWRSG